MNPDANERRAHELFDLFHHGDPLVPRQQRFGQYTRSLMKGLDARYPSALRPGRKKYAPPLTVVKVAVFQRIDQAGFKQPIDERILADADTLMVFGLDHILSEQEAAPEEIAAIREWLKREGTCLLLAPHHDVGFDTQNGRAHGRTADWPR